MIRRALVARPIDALLMPAAVALALVLPAMTHEAPRADWLGDEISATRFAGPVNIPTWETHGDAFPACVPNEPGGLYDEFGVVFLDGSTGRIPFGEAFDRQGDDNPANDVWVVAGCES